jgi:hypothetical protein
MMSRFSERRLVENEMVFRQANQKVQDGLEALRLATTAEGHPELVPDTDIKLHFYCECSNEKCRERIELTAKKYRSLHKNRQQFVIIPGHEVEDVETVRLRNDGDYSIVEKHMKIPEHAVASRLHKTDL